MALPQGINFRSTAGFVTDGADEDAELGTAYPWTTAQGNTVGYESGFSGNTRDRNSGNDARLAGAHFNTNTTKARWRIDLPSAGSHNIRVAIGDAGGYGGVSDCEVLDTTTSLGVIVSSDTSARQRFRDATDVELTEVTWPTSNTAASLTFSSTICRFDLGGGSGSNPWAHIYIEAATGGGTTYNDTLSESVTVADSLATIATFPNTLSESITPADSYASAVTWGCTLTEAIGLLDTVDPAGSVYAVTLTEAIALADAYAASGGSSSIWTPSASAGGTWAASDSATGTWTPLGSASGTWTPQ